MITNTHLIRQLPREELGAVMWEDGMSFHAPFYQKREVFNDIKHVFKKRICTLVSEDW